MSRVLHSCQGILTRFLVIAAASLALTVSAARAQNGCLCFLDFPKGFWMVTPYDAWLDTCGTGKGGAACYRIAEMLSMGDASSRLWGYGPFWVEFPAGSIVMDTGRAYRISDIDPSFKGLRDSLTAIESRFGTFYWYRPSIDSLYAPTDAYIFFDHPIHCWSVDTALSQAPMTFYGQGVTITYLASVSDDKEHERARVLVNAPDNVMLIENIDETRRTSGVIFNVWGQAVQTLEVDHQWQALVSIEDLPSGRYMLLLDNDVIPFVILR